MNLPNHIYLILALYLLTLKCAYSYIKKPRVLLSVNARNEEYILPTFLGYIDRLDYPKDRISILIQTDHNEDETFEVISEWVTKTKHFYHKVKVKYDASSTQYIDSTGPNHWSAERYENVLRLHQIALDEGREQWADYIFFVNVDNILLDENVLNTLMGEEKTMIAPMLRLFEVKSGYSNFWAGMDEKGYYKRVPEYWKILKYETIGTFNVPMIHSTMLFDLRDNRTDRLQFYPFPRDYVGEIDDLLIFGYTVKAAGIPLYVCNKKMFGYILTTYPITMTLRERHQTFTDNFIDYIAYFPPLARSEYIDHKFPVATKNGFDEVFMINLIRRPDRRIKMELSLKELGLDYKYFPAVDGKNFTAEIVKEMGVKAMGDFKDPYLERPLTFGEIGCFMSHWNIWLEIIDRDLEMTLVLEDDIRFEPDFNTKLADVMSEARGLLAAGIEWDILYLGRKPLVIDGSEQLVTGCKAIVWAKYSYWTLGYIVRKSGAQKLLDGKPLGKMIPVDEYIPIMFGEHTDDELLEKFFPRNMIGLSAAPLILFPTHYIGDHGYFSDTEDTLSFEGEDVTKFRDAKEKERELEELEKAKKEEQKEKKQSDKSVKISPKTEADADHLKSAASSVGSVDAAIHGEL